MDEAAKYFCLLGQEQDPFPDLVFISFDLLVVPFVELDGWSLTLRVLLPLVHFESGLFKKLFTPLSKGVGSKDLFLGFLFSLKCTF